MNHVLLSLHVKIRLFKIVFKYYRATLFSSEAMWEKKIFNAEDDNAQTDVQDNIAAEISDDPDEGDD